jgi:ppGpp synthetase/RelA/SpoT-type nucleotidyltranferase
MTTDSHWFATQTDAYARLQQDFREFAGTLRAILQAAAGSLGISAIVQARAKTMASFAEKIQRKKDKYVDPVHQLTDLCGARVITDSLEETGRLCRFVREHFDIDEANSLDVLDRLPPDAFGYRSVHFVVSLRPGVFPDVPERFYARQDSGAQSGQAGLAGPRFKAEIQVRTLLQHAWATIAHDTLYKSAFSIPARWTREAARIAALLEDADASFGRLLTEVAAYTSDFGASMTQDQIKKEIANQEAVLGLEPENQAIARRIARLALAAADWDKAVAVLSPLAAGGGPVLRRDLAEARILSGDQAQIVQARLALRSLVEARPEDARSLELLAECTDEAGAALDLAERAFRAAPGEPRLLRGFLERKLVRERQTGFLPVLAPVFDAAIDLSRERARLGVGLPWTCHDIGLLELLRGRPYAGLEALALAASQGEAGREVETLIRRLAALSEAVGQALPGLDWSGRFLELVLRAGCVFDGAGDCVADQDCPDRIEGPVVVVAGGCHPDDAYRLEAYRDLLMDAFRDFRGTVVCGGTTAGISGLIGDLPGAKTGAIRLLAYLPGHLPRGVAEDEHYAIRPCDGQGFTPLGAIQGWWDILASGLRPGDVRMLGVGGGDIAAAEYRMAVALGARVGLLRDSGRAVHAMLADPLWTGKANLLSLPSDAATVREFLDAATGTPFAAADIETMARLVHENYCREQKRKAATSDAALVAWEDLSDNLKDSNRSVAAHDVFKLGRVGFGIRRKDPAAISLPAFSDGQIEIMAELEHARWNMERLRSGWRPGPRDHAARTSPYLVSWAELPDAIKGYDRDNVRLMADRLKAVGYEVYPVPAGRGAVVK